MRVDVNGAQLCVDTFGDQADAAVLLIMGAAASMDRWEPAFCEAIAARGRFVIRYDHRDTGGSTTYPPGRPGYTGDDLTADAHAVLDALDVERAHIVGLSAGGGIAQRLAVDHPERLLSLTLMCTSPIGTGGADLPPMAADVFGESGDEPDWADRDATIAFLLEAERPYAGARGVDEDEMREILGVVYDRSPSLASANNHFLLDGSDIERARLAEISVPTLVVHGTHDPLFPGHGEVLAREIPGAQLVVIDGLGHEFPRWAWREMLRRRSGRRAGQARRPEC
jgi:pimeloyl-ACP methyl ester carboxylesterase